jgi:hypothetical protein
MCAKTEKNKRELKTESVNMTQDIRIHFVLKAVMNALGAPIIVNASKAEKQKAAL